MVRADSTTIGTVDQARTRRMTVSPSPSEAPGREQHVGLVAACLDLGAQRVSASMQR